MFFMSSIYTYLCVFLRIRSFFISYSWRLHLENEDGLRRDWYFVHKSLHWCSAGNTEQIENIKLLLELAVYIIIELFH